MEVTAAVKNSTYTEGSTLTDKINRYILSNRASIASIAKEIGYSRTTVSRYLAGKYDSDTTDIETKLAEFLSRQTGETVTPPAGTPGPSWASAKAARNTSGWESSSLAAATARPTPCAIMPSSPGSPISNATTP